MTLRTLTQTFFFCFSVSFLGAMDLTQQQGGSGADDGTGAASSATQTAAQLKAQMVSALQAQATDLLTVILIEQASRGADSAQQNYARLARAIGLLNQNLNQLASADALKHTFGSINKGDTASATAAAAASSDAAIYSQWAADPRYVLTAAHEAALQRLQLVQDDLALLRSTSAEEQTRLNAEVRLAALETALRDATSRPADSAAQQRVELLGAIAKALQADNTSDEDHRAAVERFRVIGEELQAIRATQASTTVADNVAALTARVTAIETTAGTLVKLTEEQVAALTDIANDIIADKKARAEETARLDALPKPTGFQRLGVLTIIGLGIRNAFAHVYSYRYTAAVTALLYLQSCQLGLVSGDYCPTSGNWSPA